MGTSRSVHFSKDAHIDEMIRGATIDWTSGEVDSKAFRLWSQNKVRKMQRGLQDKSPDERARQQDKIAHFKELSGWILIVMQDLEKDGITIPRERAKLLFEFTEDPCRSNGASNGKSNGKAGAQKNSGWAR